MAKRPVEDGEDEGATSKRSRNNSSLRPVSRAIAPSVSLPDQIDVDAAIQLRKTEILSLHRAINQGRKSTNTRAWQLLPRSLRRRAASHNLLRIPSRLREKARAELRASNTTAKSRSEMRRKAPERTLLGFVRRRNALTHRAARPDRRWLETHLWHAKRFRMSQDKKAQDGGAGTFGFSLAESPHQKSFRASDNQCLGKTKIHDASYTTIFHLSSTSSLKHPELATKRLQLLLHLAGAAHGWEDQWTLGTHICLTTLLQRPTGERASRAQCLYLAPLAPIRILWANRCKQQHSCYIFVHPAGEHEVQTLLSQALTAVNNETNHSSKHVTCLHQRWDVPVNIHIKKLSNAPAPTIAAGTTHTRRGKAHSINTVDSSSLEGFNIFEVQDTARSSLGNVLEPAEPSTRAEGASLRYYRHIIHERFSSYLEPVDTYRVMCFSVQDPRISFPPRAAAKESSEKYVPIKKLDELKREDVDTAKFFSYKKLPSFSKGELDRRRSKTPPGEKFLPTKADDRVPVIVIVNPHSASSLWDYTLLVPRGWGLPFWQSLMFGERRLAIGQQQLRQLHLSKGMLSFPHDWVSSRAYAKLEQRAAQERYHAWALRPPAKRVNYDRPDTYNAHPFGGMEVWYEAMNNAANAKLDSKLILMTPVLSTSWPRLLRALQKEPVCATRIRFVTLWQRRAFEAGVAIDPLPPVLSTLQQSFVPIQLVASSRGVFEIGATLHLPASLDDSRSWRLALKATKREKLQARSIIDTLECGPVTPHIGAVTTGNYSLTAGRGKAIGSISLSTWLELEKREEMLIAEAGPRQWGKCKQYERPLSHLLLVRNPHGGRVRIASASLLNT
ncbi:ribonuclease P [Malassezia yamatoensis]|uniref:Ribonuclease P n=1 Tax=Malassezia yamatoensis TaxID=253288 RepID=A0AAJ5YR83_9BASI|nr:ribonuclease P [Malassezia yamatoensis]